MNFTNQRLCVNYIFQKLCPAARRHIKNLENMSRSRNRETPGCLSHSINSSTSFCSQHRGSQSPYYASRDLDYPSFVPFFSAAEKAAEFYDHCYSSRFQFIVQQKSAIFSVLRTGPYQPIRSRIPPTGSNSGPVQDIGPGTNVPGF